MGFLGLRLKELGVVIITIAYAEIIKVVLNNTDKFLPALGGPMGLFVPVVTNVWNATITVLILGVLLFRMHNSKIGRAIKAVGLDEPAAESLGVNKTSIKLFLMVASGFLCGISGGLLAHYTGYIEPGMFGFPLLVEAVAFAVVGGIGNMWGSVVGVLLVDIFLESVTFLVGWRVFMYGALILLIMLFRPSGIITDRGLNIWGRFISEKLRALKPGLKEAG
jgi:branched-chain amino acid transport system permease protein